MDSRLEERYVVLKLNRMTMRQKAFLKKFLSDTGIEHCKVDGVVIEEDWPEYRPVIDMIFGRLSREASD